MSSQAHRQTLDSTRDLLELHERAPERYPFLLESVAHGTPQSRFDILFAFPQSRLSLAHDGTVTRDGMIIEADGFLNVLEETWAQAHRADDADGDLPFHGGWFVYLGYEIAREIEPKLPTLPAASGLPVAAAVRIPAAIIRDHARQQTHVVCEADASHLAATLLQDLADDRSDAAVTADNGAAPDTPIEEDPPLHYLRDVQRIKDYIHEGDVFQVNLSRSWRSQLPGATTAAAIYRRLRATNPGPFAGLAMFDSNRAIISSSPERLVRTHGTRVETRPIAGTYPRSRDEEQDRVWSQELLRHPKERAEHVMLIDLERNDLGRVCRPGSVRVTESMVLESYQHVHHIVSEVSGTLKAAVTPVDVLRAVFPGGTITGCPKVRCMEIISELEQVGRGAYTGSFGYINRDGSMDFNILIRTLIKDGAEILFRAGAGIVADSVPQRELEETRAKAKGMRRALEPE